MAGDPRRPRGPAPTAPIVLTSPTGGLSFAAPPMYTSGWLPQNTPIGMPQVTANTPAPTSGGGGYSFNPGPYQVGAPGWAAEHYGMRTVGSTYSNIHSGKSNQNRDWRRGFDNADVSDEALAVAEQRLNQARMNANRKGGSSMAYIRAQRQYNLLKGLRAARDQGVTANPNGYNSNTSNSNSSNAYSPGGQWANGLVNWSI